MNFIYKTRIVLVNMGKSLPFVMCAIVLLSYADTTLSLMTGNFVEWNGYVIPCCKLSWFIGEYFEYDLITLVAFVILSIAIETCVYNKLACLYLGINLAEKSYFDFELEPTAIYIICIANIIVAGYLTYKGIRILTSLRKQIRQ